MICPDFYVSQKKITLLTNVISSGLIFFSILDPAGGDIFQQRSFGPILPGNNADYHKVYRPASPGHATYNTHRIVRHGCPYFHRTGTNNSHGIKKKVFFSKGKEKMVQKPDVT